MNFIELVYGELGENGKRNPGQTYIYLRYLWSEEMDKGELTLL